MEHIRSTRAIKPGIFTAQGYPVVAFVYTDGVYTGPMVKFPYAYGDMPNLPASQVRAFDIYESRTDLRKSEFCPDCAQLTTYCPTYCHAHNCQPYWS